MGKYTKVERKEYLNIHTLNDKQIEGLTKPSIKFHYCWDRDTWRVAGTVRDNDTLVVVIKSWNKYKRYWIYKCEDIFSFIFTLGMMENSSKTAKAREFAERHEQGELTLMGNLGGVYGYSRIFNAEICAYERGWDECLAKAKKYILEHTTAPYETDKNGEVLAENFIQSNKVRMEIVEDFEKYINYAEE